jgi:RNA polymerase sigma-70 factor, ECF subfamily
MKGSARDPSPAIVHWAAREVAIRARSDLERLYLEHARAVARWAARLGGPTIEVEDVVQDVFLIAERRLRSFRGHSSVRTWLYGITANVVRHHRRKLRSRAWLLGDEPLDSAKSEARSPLEELVRDERIQNVRSALEQMREKHRTVLELHAIEGLSGPEIAVRLGIAPSTVWVRLHRARKELEKLLLALVIPLLLAIAAGAASAAIARIEASRQETPPIEHPTKRRAIGYRAIRYRAPIAIVRAVHREARIEKINTEHTEHTEHAEVDLLRDLGALRVEPRSPPARAAAARIETLTLVRAQFTRRPMIDYAPRAFRDVE